MHTPKPSGVILNERGPERFRGPEEQPSLGQVRGWGVKNLLLENFRVDLKRDGLRRVTRPRSPQLWVPHVPLLDVGNQYRPSRLARMSALHTDSGVNPSDPHISRKPLTPFAKNFPRICRLFPRNRYPRLMSHSSVVSTRRFIGLSGEIGRRYSDSWVALS